MWSSQQEFPVTDYPELVGHNYCRNPGNSEDRPWCFTEYDDQLHRELCDVPQCGRLPKNIQKKTLIFEIF